MEKQISFTCVGQKLYGMLHLPEGKGPFPALSFFHGFTGQRFEPHQLFVKTARALAKKGIAALRFDFRGSGESEGDFLDMTMSGEVADALESLKFLRNQAEVDSNRLGVLGLSMGGFAASCVAAQDPGVKALILWAAGAQAAKMFPRYVHLTDQNKKKWMEAGSWDFGGNLLGKDFLEDLSAMEEPLEKLDSFNGKALVIHGDGDAAVPVSEAEVYRKKLGTKAEVHILPGADHTFNRRDWEEKVIQLTVDWAKKNL